MAKSRDLVHTLHVVEKLSHMLTSAKAPAPQVPDPITMKVYKKAPPNRPDFPGLTPGKERLRPNFWEVDESTSEVLAEAMKSLMETYYKAKDVEARMQAARQKAEKKLQDTLGQERNEVMGQIPQKKKEVWQVVEKNRGVIHDGESQILRMMSMVVELMGETSKDVAPEPLPEDPRVEAAIAWVAKKMPTALAEFMKLLEQVEATYISEQESDSVTTPKTITVLDPTKQFDVQKTSALGFTAFDVIQVLSSLWGKLKSVVMDLKSGADELEGLVM